MTYAIIELGGKQYRVEKGGSVLVDRVDAKEGAKLSPRTLLYKGDKETVLDGPGLDKVKVEAVVVEHVKGEKIRVFKYRPKKRYKRTHGHRSLLTRLEISEIKGPGAGPAGGRSTAAKDTAAKKEKAPAKKAEPKSEVKSEVKSENKESS